MFSKEEALQIKKEIWIAFAAEYPKKWILYNTKIKDVTFKFHIDNKKAQVLLDIEPKEENKRIVYYEKVESLKNILLEEYLPEAIFHRNFYLPSVKILSGVWVEEEGICINNKKTWPLVLELFSEKMDAFERFFYEHEDYIKDLEINT